MLDIDDFKYINDHFGHIKGDEVLIKVTQLINETIREIDTVGRYGGEEFLVIFSKKILKSKPSLTVAILDS